MCVVNQKCIRNHAIEYSLARRHDAATKKVSPERLIRIGDVLVNSTGTGTLGRVAQVRYMPAEPTTVDSHVTIVRPGPGMFDLNFFGYALIAIEREIQEGGEGCGGQTELARSKLEHDYWVAFPTDLSDQRRIVAILDEAFAGIATATDNAEKNLQNAREIFEIQLQSVFDASGDCAPLSSLTTDISDGDHSPPPKAPRGVPFITISNIDKATRSIDFRDTFFVPDDYFRNLKSNRKPRRGDVLYTVTGTFGIPVLVTDDIDFCFQRHIGLIRPKSDTDSAWLSYALLSPQTFRQATTAATGTAQKTVSLTALRNIVVPRRSLEEQRATAAKLDSLSAETQRLERIYGQKLRALAELKQSLLQKAFNGDLPDKSAQRKIA